MHQLDEESTCGLEIPIGPILVSLVDTLIGFGIGSQRLPSSSALPTGGQRLWGRSISRDSRRSGLCSTLRFALTGPGYSVAFVIGEFNCANASRGWLMTGAFAKTGSGGTIVGRLVDDYGSRPFMRRFDADN